MGSLVPGWDAAPGVPNGFQDEEPQQQERGYFARLEASKSLKRTSAGPQYYSNAPPSLSSSVGATSMMARASVPAPPPAHHGLHGSTPHNKFPKPTATDWEAELKSLGGDKGRNATTQYSLGRHSVDPLTGAPLTDSGRSSSEQQAGAASQQQQQRQPHNPTWWSQFDSGALNRGAAEAAAEEAALAGTRAQDLRAMPGGNLADAAR